MPYPFLILVYSAKQNNKCIQDVLKETMKKLTFHLHPVAIYGQDHEKQKTCRTSYQSLFELQNMFRWIHFLVWSFESEDFGKEERKEKTSKILNIWRMKRGFKRQDTEKFHFNFPYLQFKDLKSYSLKSIYFKSLNCK